MANNLCEVNTSIGITGPDGTQEINIAPIRFVPGNLLPKRERVSLTGSTFTALSPPSGAQFVLVDLGTSVSLTVKGVTGDTGSTCAPTSAPVGGLILLSLGTAPSIGLTNGSATAQVVTVIWL